MKFAVMVMRGLTFYPVVLSFCIIGLYLVDFFSLSSGGWKSIMAIGEF